MTTMTPNPHEPTRAHRRLLDLADRCERAATQLTADAADPAATLAERGYHPSAEETAAFGARHQGAADTAARYAAQLREQVAAGQPVTAAQIAQAEKVTDAAELGGILIDGRRQAQAQDADPFTSPELRQATRDYHQAKRQAIEGSGQFIHVAEEGQVPFWQLGPATQAETEHVQRDQAAEVDPVPVRQCEDGDDDVW